MPPTCGGHGVIAVDARWSAGLTDAEMDCVLAHEIGHILQYDSGRLMARPTMELDADNRAAQLCGPDNWYPFFERYIGARLAE